LTTNLRNIPVVRGTHPTTEYPKNYFDLVVNLEDKLKQEDAAYELLYYKRGNPQKKKELKLQQYTGLGDMVRVEELQPWSQDTMYEGYGKTITPVAYNIAMVVGRMPEVNDQIGMYKQIGSMIAQSHKRTKKKNLMNVYNNAFVTTNYTCADGEALCSTVHPNESGAGTSANRPAVDADLSYASLVQARADLLQTSNGRSDFIEIVPKVLLIPPSLEAVAHEILKSAQKPDTTDNNTNFVKSIMGDLKVVVSPHLVDPDAWFLLSSHMDNCFPVQYVETQGLTSKIIDLDMMAMSPKMYTAWAWYVFDIGYWRGVYGSPGA
jgi:Mu-like prophage major head subunit gpT